MLLCYLLRTLSDKNPRITEPVIIPISIDANIYEISYSIVTALYLKYLFYSFEFSFVNQIKRKPEHNAICNSLDTEKSQGKKWHILNIPSL